LVSPASSCPASAALRRRAAEAGQELAGDTQRPAERAHEAPASRRHCQADGRPVAAPSLAEMLAGANTSCREQRGICFPRLSEDERAFGQYLEHRHQEGRLWLAATQALGWPSSTAMTQGTRTGVGLALDWVGRS